MALPALLLLVLLPFDALLGGATRGSILLLATLGLLLIAYCLRVAKGKDSAVLARQVLAPPALLLAPETVGLLLGVIMAPTPWHAALLLGAATLAGLAARRAQARLLRPRRT